jgi:actin-related protein
VAAGARGRQASGNVRRVLQIAKTYGASAPEGVRAAGGKRGRGAATAAAGNEEEDDFGLNDADWDIYLPRAPATAPVVASAVAPAAPAVSCLEEWEVVHRVRIGSERVRVPEALLQPSLLGLAQAGLPEAAARLLGRLPATDARDLAGDILLCGGPARTPGLGERLATELRALLPADCPVRVRTAPDPERAPWRGAAAWARSPASSSAFFTRAAYLEHGPHRFPRGPLGNAPPPASALPLG